MTEKKRKALYWGLKVLSIIVSVAPPIIAICEKYPLWTERHGVVHTVSVGTILALIVLIVVFRKTVFDFIRDKFNVKHAPPIMIWLVMLVCTYVLIFIGDFMQDMTTVLWMGLIGCGVGTFLTYLSNKYGVKSNE